jgi:hypothetical protein
MTTRLFRTSVLSILLTALTGPIAAGQPGGVRLGINSFLGNLEHSEIRGPTCVRGTTADRTNYLDAVRDLGVRTIRETWSWAEMEPEQGKGYRFEVFDDIAQQASAREIEIIAVVHPFPDWATGAKATPPNTPLTIMLQLPQRQFEPDFRRFVRAVVSRYSGQSPKSLSLKRPIRRWIFANEIDWSGGDTSTTSPDTYAYWLRIFYGEVKAIDPQAEVAVMGFGNPMGDSYLPKLLASHDLKGLGYPYFDAMSIHIYPGASVPVGQKGTDDAVAVFKRRLREHKIRADLWVTETGHGDRDIAIQSLICVAATGVSRVHLHGLWDIPGWGGSVLANTPSGQTPVSKPLFFMYKTLLDKIGDNRGVKLLSPGCYQVLLPERRASTFFGPLAPRSRKVISSRGASVSPICRESSTN